LQRRFVTEGRGRRRRRRRKRERERERKGARKRGRACTTHQSGLSPRSFPTDTGRRTDGSPGCWTQRGSPCPASPLSHFLPLGPPG